jgi:hypothetical protein
MFYENDINYLPQFDKIVDYKKYKGHLLDYIEYINNEYIIIFYIIHFIKYIQLEV